MYIYLLNVYFVKNAPHPLVFDTLFDIKVAQFRFMSRIQVQFSYINNMSYTL